jgi:hypothetical protein
MNTHKKKKSTRPFVSEATPTLPKEWLSQSSKSHAFMSFFFLYLLLLLKAIPEKKDMPKVFV